MFVKENPDRKEKKKLVAGADSEILKRGSALCRPPGLIDEENFRFQMV